MIGMMNAGNSAEVPDFYSSPIRSSLYAQRRRATITYTEDGRTLLGGHPTVSETPERMWQNLILRVVCHTLCEDSLKKGRKSKKRSFFGRQRSIQSELQQPQKTVISEKNPTDGLYITKILVENLDENVYSAKPGVVA